MASPVLTPILGLMAGTSVDGIDASIILTDGEQCTCPGLNHQHPYRDETRAAIFAAMQAPHEDHTALGLMIADDHAMAAKALIRKAGISPRLIGFHGQTIHHDPDAGETVQIGNSHHLAAQLGLPVACDFRRADMAAGGQGAPLAPLYHQAVITALGLPLTAAVVNIGGISNISIWDGETLCGFDTGPGNGLMDQLARDVLGRQCDEDGRLAAAGQPDLGWVEAVLNLPYFSNPAPKSLDRQDLFDWCAAITPPQDPADRMASFLSLTASSILRATEGCSHVLVTGGGARNPVLMQAIREGAGCPVTRLDDHGRDGDFLEAELMAYLAVRVERGLALTLPTTTGVTAPTPGGRIITP
ncbi:MAG: anhydro-N-acetylmuramic acid kinase [Candidatus Puniceispirillales bacterium]